MQAHDGQPDRLPPTVGQAPGQVDETACVDCGWPDTDAAVVSRHRTSEGVVVWTRCICGALQVRLHRPGLAEEIARGRQPHAWWDGRRP